ncbi:hypothetical protein I3843_04G178200 [Carya illinoinensis]|nr:hypothetical protein I3760_04G187200 [Carya illinoinensis]KAG7984785.1 hypothetical protein I3843_04G178200 [Carya illinoinensis]
MSTKTMRLPPRRVLTPKVIDKKRKEREGLGLGALEPSSKPSRSKPAGCVDDPIPSNRLLAGYLAHEFLTRGTLLGLPWDPAKKEAVPVSGRGKQRDDGEAEPSGGAERRRGRRQVEDHQRNTHSTWHKTDLQPGGKSHKSGPLQNILCPKAPPLLLQIHKFF